MGERLNIRHSGVGMRPDHSGVALVFQLFRPGIKTIGERLAALEAGG